MEILVVGALALLLFGPEQLPQIARQIGKVLGDLRKGSSMIRREWYNAVYPPADELRREVNQYSAEMSSLRKDALSLQPPTSGALTQSSVAPETSTGSKTSNPSAPKDAQKETDE